MCVLSCPNGQTQRLWPIHLNYPLVLQPWIYLIWLHALITRTNKADSMVNNLYRFIMKYLTIMI